MHGDLLDLTLFSAMFSDALPTDGKDHTYQEKREFALALCLFTKYLG